METGGEFFFRENLSFVLGNNWSDPWLAGNGKLKDRLPRLFALSNHKEALIRDCWLVKGESWCLTWNFFFLK